MFFNSIRIKYKKIVHQMEPKTFEDSRPNEIHNAHKFLLYKLDSRIEMFQKKLSYKTSWALGLSIAGVLVAQYHPRDKLIGIALGTFGIFTGLRAMKDFRRANREIRDSVEEFEKFRAAHQGYEKYQPPC